MIKIRKLHATPEENTFIDMVDFCAYIAVSHDKKNKSSELSKTERTNNYAIGNLSINYQRLDFQLPDKKVPMPYFNIRLIVRNNKNTVLHVSGKAYRSSNFDLKTEERTDDNSWEEIIRGHVYECNTCYDEFSTLAKPTLFQTKMAELAEKCVSFAASRGKTTVTRNDPFAWGTRLQFKDRRLTICCDTGSSPYSNGYCKIIVRVNKTLVFDAEGNYGVTPYRVKAKKYVPGDWEELLY